MKYNYAKNKFVIINLIRLDTVNVIYHLNFNKIFVTCNRGNENSVTKSSTPGQLIFGEARRKCFPECTQQNNIHVN